MLKFFQCALVVVTLSSLAPSTATAEPCHDLAPWSRIGVSVQHLAEPRSLMLATAAPLATVLLVPTGADHQVRVFSQTDLGGRYHYEPLSVPAPYVLLGVVLAGYGVSLAAGSCEWQRPQAAILQAMGLTAITVAMLKWSVGRQWPNAGREPGAPDKLEHPEFATDFEPFRRWGAWPSGHTASMFAAAAALRTAGKHLGWPAWLGYPLAAGVGFGMLMNDRHWASDIVAGALLGEAIGSSVGQSFQETAGSDLQLLVLPTADHGAMLALTSFW